MRWLLSFVFAVFALRGGALEVPTFSAKELGLRPLTVTSDPGPTAIRGAGENSEGTFFYWVDVDLEGTADQYRLYFDFLDNRHFHFMDRRGELLQLGLCEGGVERILAEANLDKLSAPELGTEALVLPITRLRLARHDIDIAVFTDNRLLVRAVDDRIMGGRVGIRQFEEGQQLSLRTHSREEIHFNDDFMREDKDTFAWKPYPAPEGGTFEIKSLRNPLLSANAFCYMGDGHGSRAIAGQSWWTNYRFQLSLRGPKEAALGVIFCYRDEHNYGLFRWTARNVDAKGTVTGEGKRELILVREGQEELLQQAEGGYLPGQWYRANIESSYAGLRIHVDGHPFFETRHPLLSSGAIGVWCDVPPNKGNARNALSINQNSLFRLMGQHAVFDDVHVESIEGVEDRFSGSGPLGNGWLTGPGNWQLMPNEQDPDAGGLEVNGLAGFTKALIGNRNWSQYRVQCEVNAGEAKAGLVLLYRDESNHFIARIVRDENPRLELIEIEAGRARIAMQKPLNWLSKPAEQQDVRLVAEINGAHVGAVALRLDEAIPAALYTHPALVDAYVGQGHPRGRAGLYFEAAQQKQRARYRNFVVRILKEAESLVTTNAIFDDESTMKEWNSRSQEWYPPQSPLIVNGREVDLLWHRSQFPGDVELIVEPTEMVSEQHEVALSISKTGEEGQRNNGYVYRYSASVPQDDGTRRTQIALIRNGVTVADRILPADHVRELASLALLRSGHFLVAKINGEAVCVFQDEEPLAGSKLAFYTDRIKVRPEAVQIKSRHFLNELFARAPVDWRTAGFAVAEVTSRWQCDSRWSFFSIGNDRMQGKPAVLWLKRKYPGDVTVEFYVGHRMEGERGRPYAYAKDINVTIGSDGEDLNKGYTLLWGGHNNSGTFLYRDGVEVLKYNATVPTTMNYHRHWFSYRVEKRGGRISYRIDRFFGNEPNGELVYQDPTPLTGDRIAIWTYDHAVMLSRVRISGSGGTEYEDPNQVFQFVRTPYDSKQPAQ